VRAALFLALATLACGPARAQSKGDAVEPAVIAHPAPTASPDPSNERILGVIPNYQTVNDPKAPYKALTAGQKFKMFARETADPFTFAGAAMGAAISQADRDDPKYGQGRGAYADRFGAAVADVATQNFFADAVLASLLHTDPRYFRRGPEYSIFSRAGYALSRIVVTRRDSGGATFNYSGILGMSMGIALSNAYYPEKSVNAPEFGSRITTSLLSAALGNLLPEFWPDIHEKFFHRHKN
jgi:hypothetical protein